uniref:Uncharacterized protein n=1 Tax=Anguilla anguilla TaxID=7936 RepID=A0A0E9U9P0_ANGAN
MEGSRMKGAEDTYVPAYLPSPGLNDTALPHTNIDLSQIL